MCQAHDGLPGQSWPLIIELVVRNTEPGARQRSLHMSRLADLTLDAVVRQPGRRRKNRDGNWESISGGTGWD